MMRCIPVSRSLKKIIAITLAVLSLYIAGGMNHAAYAAPAPALDASCAQMSQYGFTTGLVYCVEASISKAVADYIPIMQDNMRGWETMAAIVAVAMFGIKLMNSNVQYPLKEGMTVIFRILIGVFFYSQSLMLYQEIAGVPPNNDGVINEAIGWVTGLGTDANPDEPTMFKNLLTDTCKNQQQNNTKPPGNFEGNQVWQAFDCIFSKLFGAANPTKHPYAFGTSLLIIIAASLFSATMGLAMLFLGITVLLVILKIAFKALYLVLMAYICIGFMAIFAPLLAPLLFFNSKYLTEKFMNWLGIIVSCIVQPVMVIGFLAMAIVVDDNLLEGVLPGGVGGCQLPTYPTANQTFMNSTPPPGGWGQDGSGVCSFKQLLNQGNAEASDADDLNLMTVFHDLMEDNSTQFNLATNGDYQTQDNTHNTNVSNRNFAPAREATTNLTNKVPLANPFVNMAGNIDFTGATRLKKYVPIKQLMLTLITFIFVTFVMKSLLTIIPTIASQMTISAGVALAAGGFSAMQLPFEGMIGNTLSATKNILLQSAKEKRLFGSTKPTAAQASLRKSVGGSTATTNASGQASVPRSTIGNP